MKSTTNQVRQILANELGLTRESVREMAREFVADTVEREIRRLVEGNDLDRIIAGQFARLAEEDVKYGGTGLRARLERAMQSVINQWVRENIAIKQAEATGGK